VTAQGDAYCWGENSSGQLGDGTRVDRHEPAKVKTSVRFVAARGGCGAHVRTRHRRRSVLLGAQLIWSAR
jgi:alpha-tubulin suppressor-like RCC1 family protein